MWTKEHSRNAVAAKRRRRLERADRPAAEPRRYVPHPRPTPDFTIQIRSRSGDRVQVSVTRLGRRFLTADGVKSAREISRGIEVLLREATP